jgi:hypothetical protein
MDQIENSPLPAVGVVGYFGTWMPELDFGMLANEGTGLPSGGLVSRHT